MNIKHFGFLSSVIRKRESHEQDGERLPRVRFAPVVTASGDPAMAFMFFQRLARTDTPSGSFGSHFLEHELSENRYPLFGIMLQLPRNGGRKPAHSARGNPRARKT
jgi:hypothetical protein